MLLSLELLIVWVYLTSVKMSSADMIPQGMKETSNNWDKRAFSGIRPRSIVVIKKIGPKPLVKGYVPYIYPHICHGTLINYRTALTPCSCVSYTTPNQTYDVHPWHHPEQKGYVEDRQQYLTFDTRPMKVWLLADEQVDHRQETDMSWFQCHRRDNNYHLYDFAMIYLKQTLKNSKVAWIHTAEFYSFTRTMDYIKDAIGRTGHCQVFQWTPWYRVHPNFGNEWTTRSWLGLYSIQTQHVLQRFDVSFTEWINCRENYCPNTPWPKSLVGTRKFRRNEMLCNNTQVPQKICLTWKDYRSLCSLTRGTPVFCDITPEIRGFMGFLVDATSYCSDGHYASMLPLSYGIDFIAKELRIRESKEYSDSIPTYIKDMRGITLW